MRKNFSDDSDSPRAVAVRRFKEFSAKLTRGCRKIARDEGDAAILAALRGKAGHPDRILLSDLSARWEASKKLVELMSMHRSVNKASNYYFVTFTDDVGVTSDRVPILNVKAIHDKVYRTLKALGVNAVVVIEVHPLMNYPREGKGRSLLAHAHTIAWSPRPLDSQDAQAMMTQSGSWKCTLGARPVDVRAIGAGADDMARAAYYVLKPPHSAKNRMPSKADPNRFVLMDTTRGYRPEFAVRVFEGLTQVEMMDVVFSVGDGSTVRQALRAHLAEWHRQRTPNETCVSQDFDVWKWWFDLRAQRGSKKYLPYRFVGVGARLRSAPHSNCLPSRPMRVVPKSGTRITRRQRQRSSGFPRPKGTGRPVVRQLD